MTPDARAVVFVARLAPWLAPLPTAYLVYARTLEHLAWPWPVALAAGLTIELLGLAATFTALGAYTWNRTKRKSDPAAPLALPFVLVGVYFIAAELLTVGLDIAGQRATFAEWSQALFPVLSLVGMAVLAVRVDQEQRVASVACAKAEARAQRAETRKLRASAKDLEQPVASMPEPAPVIPQPAGYFCDRCRQTIIGQPEYAGHRRWCASKNGNGKEIEHVGPGSNQGATRAL